MAVDAKGNLVHARNLLLKFTKQPREVRRDGIAHGVGDIYGGGTGSDDGLHHLEQVLRIGASSIHGGELNIAAIALGSFHHGYGQLHDLFPVLPQLVHDVYIRGGEEHVNPGRFSDLNRFPRLVHVVGMGSGQRANHRSPDLSGNVADCLEIAGGTGGETGLDNIDPKLFQLFGDLHLFFDGHPNARRLLAIAEGGIQKLNSISHDNFPCLAAYFSLGIWLSASID